MDLWNKLAEKPYMVIALEQMVHVEDLLECDLCERYMSDVHEYAHFWGKVPPVQVLQIVFRDTSNNVVQLKQYCAWCAALLEKAERKFYAGKYEFEGLLRKLLREMSSEDHQKVKEEWLQQTEDFQFQFSRRWLRVWDVIMDQHCTKVRR